MKPILIFIAFFVSLGSFAQEKQKNTLSISYFGEMVTHPGFRIGMEVPVGKWGKDKDNILVASPSVGMFHHKRYQTSYFLMPDFALKKKAKKGLEYSVGFGVGFQLSVIPNTFYIGPQDSVIQISASHWYFLGNISFALEKTILSKRDKPMIIFLKPQLTYAYPSFPNRVGYFVLEFGCKREISF